MKAKQINNYYETFKMIKLPKFRNNNYYETFKTIKLPKFELSIHL